MFLCTALSRHCVKRWLTSLVVLMMDYQYLRLCVSPKTMHKHYLYHDDIKMKSSIKMHGFGWI